jgi:hypothetical protein
MTEEKRDFRLSPDELECLVRLTVTEQSLAALVKVPEQTGRSIAIRLTPEEAEKLRDFLTTQLAMVGFDEDYNPTPTGKIIERLIDEFFVG